MQILKKITVLESSNYILDNRYKTIPIDKNLDTEEIKLLRDYVLNKINLLEYKDPEIILKTMEWVSSQWKHDGMNQAPKNMSSYEILKKVKKGERYRCVEYGRVTADILLSLGYVSRRIGVRSKDADYGGFGMGHVASEVWSNKLKKWIFVDPQFSIYAKYQSNYLNFYDMYKLKCENLFDNIEFIVPKDYAKENDINLDKYINNYKNFINNYFGYVIIPYSLDGKEMNLTLILDGKEPFMTFQGTCDDNNIFTNKPEDLYFSINNSIIIFKYKEKTDLNKVIKDFNIKTNDDYKEHMGHFAAEPNYTLTFQNNMKWFSHYEININSNGWVEIESDKYDWNLHNGINTLAVRGVNAAGKEGIPCSIKINYGN
ncbi:MAG: transglutaminase domain-containing protein [Firmicutes bacterium]|nr:transglutaminase domain-containing protein [Bacillota bacterium]